MYFSFSADVKHGVLKTADDLQRPLRTQEGIGCQRESERQSDSTLCTSDVTVSQWERVEPVLDWVWRRGRGRWTGLYLQIYEEKRAEKQEGDGDAEKQSDEKS